MDELMDYYGIMIPIEYCPKIREIEMQISTVNLIEIYQNGEAVVDCIPMKYQQYRERIVGLIYYYYAYSANIKKDHDSAWTYIIKALGYVQGEGNTQMLAKVYLLLGNIAFRNGDQTSAVESYLSVLELCEGDQYLEEKIRASFQYGKILMDYSHYEHAAEAYREGLQYCSMELVEKVGYLVYLRALCGLIICFWKLNKEDLADEYMDKLLNIQKERLYNRKMDVEIYCMKLVWALKHDQVDSIDFLEEEILWVLDDWKPESASKTAMTIILKFLLNKGRVSLIRNFYSWLSRQKNSESLIQLKEWMVEIRLAYCLEYDSCEELYKAGAEVLSQGEKHKMNRRNSFHRLSSMREEIRRIEKLQMELSLMNDHLLSDTLHDAMTGLPNRVYFADYAAQMVERLRDNSINLVVGIVDIDFFKCVNDTYGHVVGDESIIKIGKAISDWANGRLFCARYGGDEFVVIGENILTSEMEEMAFQLKESLKRMEIRNSSSPVAPYITLSQGYFVHPVEEGHNIWNFLTEADNLMYQIKRTTKNDFRVRDTWIKDWRMLNDTVDS